MRNASHTRSGRAWMLSLLGVEGGAGNRSQATVRLAILTAAICLAAALVFGQTNARIASVDPAMGKVNDSVALTGENLGKGSVVAVYLSDDKSDYKASLMDQAAGKITMKVPQVKPGNYNVSIQVGNNILIQPVMFKVAE